ADVTDRTAFEDALSRFDRRIIREKDFRRARSDLTSVKQVSETLSEAEELASQLTNERGRLSSRLRKWRHDRSQVQSRLSDLEAVTDVDPEPLVAARSSYNDRVREEFDSFAETAPAIDVARVGYKARLVPLADVPPITDEAALSVLEDAGFATETVPTVLEYAGYSDSKLSHYVDRPGSFRSQLPVSWFETIDGEAFTIAADATGDDVRHRAPALVKVIDAFATPETIAELRTLRDLAARGEYDRMRRARRLAADDAPGDVESARSQLRDLEAVIERAEAAIERIDAAPTLSG
ncbi:MAG: hypothetical protein R3324_03965, partial [Halobacteriales archaeon]|nr:hypothetical protein [Halobacteriales archaeon]